jgi:hypothetical protein
MITCHFYYLPTLQKRHFIYEYRFHLAFPNFPVHNVTFSLRTKYFRKRKLMSNSFIFKLRILPLNFIYLLTFTLLLIQQLK